MDEKLSEAMNTLQEVLGDDNIIMIPVGNDDDDECGIVIAAQGNTAKFLRSLMLIDPKVKDIPSAGTQAQG